MENDELSHLKENIRFAKLEKTAKKEETIKAFRLAKEKRRAAFRADQIAKAKAVKAEKLKQKAEMAHSTACSARTYANHLYDEANDLLELAEQKYTEIKTIEKNVSEAGRAFKKAKKLAVKNIQKANDRIGLISD